MRRTFEGITVVDLGQMYAGPYCTLLMANLGATIIKVEPPNGEPIRRRGDGAGIGTSFTLLNGNKRSLRLDLKNPKGREILLGLIRSADVLVENFGPGVMKRLGLDFETVAAENERLIFASAKGFRDKSPYRNYRAMDLTVQAIAGVMATTGFPDSPPVKAGPAFADFLTGVHMMAGISAALYQRSETGRGQYVEVSMEESTIPSLASNLSGYIDSGGRLPERLGNRHGNMAAAPYNTYETSDGWIAILCVSNSDWEGLCSACGLRRFSDDGALLEVRERIARVEEIDTSITEWTLRRTTKEAVSVLENFNIPVAPVRSLSEIVEDESLFAGGILRRVGSQGVSRIQFGSPLHLSGSVDVPSIPVRELGADSGDILREFLEWSDTEVEDARSEGVI